MSVCGSLCAGLIYVKTVHSSVHPVRVEIQSDAFAQPSESESVIERW